MVAQHSSRSLKVFSSQSHVRALRCPARHTFCVACFLSRLGAAGVQPNGHAARAIISAERRIEIWDQVYDSFQEKIPAGKWCTRDELVKVSVGKHNKFTVDELTEVIRGKKHKKELGVDSNKVDGEWLHRYAFNQRRRRVVFACLCGWFSSTADEFEFFPRSNPCVGVAEEAVGSK